MRPQYSSSESQSKSYSSSRLTHRPHRPYTNTSLQTSTSNCKDYASCSCHRAHRHKLQSHWSVVSSCPKSNKCYNNHCTASYNRNPVPQRSISKTIVDHYGYYQYFNPSYNTFIDQVQQHYKKQCNACLCGASPSYCMCCHSDCGLSDGFYTSPAVEVPQQPAMTTNVASNNAMTQTAQGIITTTTTSYQTMSHPGFLYSIPSCYSVFPPSTIIAPVSAFPIDSNQQMFTTTQPAVSQSGLRWGGELLQKTGEMFTLRGVPVVVPITSKQRRQ